MFRSKALLVGIFLALMLTYSPALVGQGEGGQVSAASVSPELPSDALGYYELDGGKTIIPIREEKGVAERMPSGMTKEEWMAEHRMSPDAEAAIVHEIPPVPFVMDNVEYAPEQIHLFDGKQLGFTTGNDGRLYAFTTFAALNDFMEAQTRLTMDGPGPEYSVFYDDINYQWQYYRIFLLPNTTLFTLAVAAHAL